MNLSQAGYGFFIVQNLKYSRRFYSIDIWSQLFFDQYKLTKSAIFSCNVNRDINLNLPFEYQRNNFENCTTVERFFYRFQSLKHTRLKLSSLGTLYCLNPDTPNYSLKQVQTKINTPERQSLLFTRRSVRIQLKYVLAYLIIIPLGFGFSIQTSNQNKNEILKKKL